MPRAPRYTARTADKHVLYEAAVQEPDAEFDFLDKVFRDRRGRLPVSIREDFGGTAYNSCVWVKRRPGNTAVAVDLHRPTLLTASKRHTGTLTAEQRSRLQLVPANVLSPALLRRPKVDAVLALNFSYWIFHQRATLVEYFAKARAALAPGGTLILDFFGGTDVHRECQDRRRCSGFTYIWDQARYDPMTGRYTCHIHFEFRDGTALRKAFTYHWRLWTLPELQDVLRDAGFTDIGLYAEGNRPDGSGDGRYRLRKGHPCDRTFLAYITAWR
jgi:hypothetical protein